MLDAPFLCKFLYSIATGITERAPTVRNVTRPVTSVQDQVLSPAWPVHLLFWSCTAPSCALSAAHTASINSMSSAINATPVVRPAQVLTINLINIFLFPPPNVNIEHLPFPYPPYVCVCAEASPRACVACDRGSTLKDRVCYPHCEEGRYFSEKV